MKSDGVRKWRHASNVLSSPPRARRPPARYKCAPCQQFQAALLSLPVSTARARCIRGMATKMSDSAAGRSALTSGTAQSPPTRFRKANSRRVCWKSDRCACRNSSAWHAEATRQRSVCRAAIERAGSTRLRAEIVYVDFNPRRRAREEEPLQDGQQDRRLCCFCHDILPLCGRPDAVADAPRARERALRLVAQQFITEHAVCARGYRCVS